MIYAHINLRTTAPPPIIVSSASFNHVHVCFDGILLPQAVLKVVDKAVMMEPVDRLGCSLVSFSARKNRGLGGTVNLFVTSLLLRRLPKWFYRQAK